MTTTMQMHPATARALLAHSQRTTTRLRAEKALRADLQRIGWPEAQLDAMVAAYRSLTPEDAMSLHNRALSDVVNGCGGMCQQGRYPCDCADPAEASFSPAANAGHTVVTLLCAAGIVVLIALLIAGA